MPTLPVVWAPHGGHAPPWRTLLLAGLAVGLYARAGPASETWVYDRAAIAMGELWRLATGHLVHADGSHALWDIAALVLLGAIFEGSLGRRLTASLVAGALTVDFWLWWCLPTLDRYCGLSGVLNSLLAAGLYELWRERREPVVLIIGATAAAKIAWEVLSEQAVLTDTLWPSVPSVHAVGFATGLAVAALGSRSLRGQYAAPAVPVSSSPDSRRYG